MIDLDPDEMIGCSYLSIPGEDGSRTRLQISEALDRYDDAAAQDKMLIRFCALKNDETVEEIISYNALLDHIEADDGENDTW